MTTKAVPTMNGVAGKVLNAVIFQAGWIATVLAAARGYALVATLAALAICALHLLRVDDRARALRVMALSGLIGFVFETILMSLGFASYAAPEPVLSLPPMWLVALWCAFGTLPDECLSWLKGRFALAAVLGALTAPLSYYAGEKLNDMMLAEPIWISLAVIGALWAAALPLIMALAGPPPERLRTAYSAASRPN